MRRIYIGVVSIAIFLAARPATAQGPGDLELNLFAGGSWHSQNAYEIGPPQSPTPIQREFKFHQAIRGGVRVNVFNSGHWGEEFLYSFESNDARFLTRNPPAPELQLGVQVHQFAVNALYYIDEDETLVARPFFTVGVGATMYRPTDEAKAIANDPLRGNMPGFGTSAEFAFNYGFGTKVKLGGRLGFRFDLRGFLTRTPSFDLPRSSEDPGAVVFPAGGAFHNGEASAGLVFYLN